MDPFFPTALFISYFICEILNNLHLTFTLIHNKKLQGDFTTLNLNRLKNPMGLGFYVEKKSSSSWEYNAPPSLATVWNKGKYS